MAARATASANLASRKDREGLALDEKQMDRVAEAIRAVGHALDSQKLVMGLVQNREEDEPVELPVKERVKRYDHRCNYEEGERVFFDNRYGRSFATITKIIRQPPQAFCDKAFMEFDDAGYRSKWEHERSTPYFAIHSGRANPEPVYVEGEVTAPPARATFNASAVVRLAKALDKALARDERFQRTAGGWELAGMSPAAAPPRPHISAEPGGVPARGPGSVSSSNALSQGSYKAPLLEAIDRMGEATIEDIKRNIQKNLTLGPDDWVADSTGKIVWLHRLHAAIKHLKRVGAIDSPRREVYRRVG